jgi:ATP-dependent Clp protease ATP-binding subunit ClpX
MMKSTGDTHPWRDIMTFDLVAIPDQDLDQHVIGQDVAKRRLALAVSNHFKRLVDTWDRDDSELIIAEADLHNVRIEKSNILVIGASGTGTTQLVKYLASHTNVPLVIDDAARPTEAG